MNDKQQLAAMGDHMAEQAEQAAQPMCMTKRIEELEAQVRVMAEALREAISVLSSINHGGEHEVHVEGDDPAFWQRGEWVGWAKSDVLPKLQAALAGKLPAPVSPEGWQLVPVEHIKGMSIAGCQVPLNKAARHNTVYRAMLAAAPKPEAK